jgi:hypothetical protein
VIKIVVLLPFCNNIDLAASFLAGTIVFFKNEVLILHSLFDYWFQNLISVYLEEQLLILVTWSLIKCKLALEVVANSTPNLRCFLLVFIISV